MNLDKSISSKRNVLQKSQTEWQAAQIQTRQLITNHLIWICIVSRCFCLIFETEKPSGPFKDHFQLYHSLGKFSRSQTDICFLLLFFFQKTMTDISNKFSLGDNLHELPIPIFWALAFSWQIQQTTNWSLSDFFFFFFFQKTTDISKKLSH